MNIFIKANIVLNTVYEYDFSSRLLTIMYYKLYSYFWISAHPAHIGLDHGNFSEYCRETKNVTE